MRELIAVLAWLMNMGFAGGAAAVAPPPAIGGGGIVMLAGRLRQVRPFWHVRARRG